MRHARSVLIVSTVLGSWLGMQAVHELGHVLGASLSGGRVSRVVLHPLTISRTDLAENPRPLFVVWAGPIFGAASPVILWLAARAIHFPGAFVLRFFAGFCLLANGLYIGIGSFEGIGDCGEMLRHGSDRWQLWLFGAATAPFGLALWHNQGMRFGLGNPPEAVSPKAAWGTAIAFGLLLINGFIVGGD